MIWQQETACKYIIMPLLLLLYSLNMTLFEHSFRLDMCGTVKVADFGLSEDMYSTNYFRQGKNGVDAVETKVPIRWMPLESIEEGLYNEKSDVVRDSQLVNCSPQ